MGREVNTHKVKQIWEPSMWGSECGNIWGCRQKKIVQSENPKWVRRSVTGVSALNGDFHLWEEPAEIHEGDVVCRLRLVHGVHGSSTLEHESNTPPTDAHSPQSLGSTSRVLPPLTPTARRVWGVPHTCSCAFYLRESTASLTTRLSVVTGKWGGTLIFET